MNSKYKLITLKDLPKQNKIITLQKAIKKIKEFKKSGKKVVYTSGVFDVLHTGHTRYLKAAKLVGDKLFVGIESDKSVKNTRGEHRPVNIALERLEMLAALEVVDHVFAWEDEIKDYSSSYEIFEKRYKDLSPDFVIMPKDSQAYNEQIEQIRNSGAEPVIIDTPLSLGTINSIDI